MLSVAKKPAQKAPEISVPKQQISTEETPTKSAPNAPSSPSVADPYVTFVAEQKKREAIWTANRAAKRSKATEASTQDDNCVPSPSPESGDRAIDQLTATYSAEKTDEVKRLKSELEEKNKTCEILTNKIEELQEASQSAAKRHLVVSENIFKVGTDLQSTKLSICIYMFSKRRV